MLAPSDYLVEDTSVSRATGQVADGSRVRKDDRLAFHGNGRLRRQQRTCATGRRYPRRSV